MRIAAAAATAAKNSCHSSCHSTLYYVWDLVSRQLFLLLECCFSSSNVIMFGLILVFLFILSSFPFFFLITYISFLLHIFFSYYVYFFSYWEQIYFLSLEFGKIIYLCRGAICLSISSYFKRIRKTRIISFSIYVNDRLLVLK